VGLTARFAERDDLQHSLRHQRDSEACEDSEAVTSAQKAHKRVSPQAYAARRLWNSC
jgi:hypothetical protein